MQHSNLVGLFASKSLSFLASLKLTVALLVMAIFIVFAGTMAQVEKGIWQVTDQYFRTAVAWIDLQIFFPSHWFPNLTQIPGGFPFPGGWLIGAAMAVNVLAAHASRFGLRPRGSRYRGGILVILLGTVMTWLVIDSGSGTNITGEGGVIQWSALRAMLQWILGGVWMACVCVLLKLDRTRKAEWSLAVVGCLVLGGAFAWTVFGGQQAALNDSSLRILWQLLKGGLASLVLLGGCAMLFKKRAGIVLIHAGVALMMLGELLVGTRAVESHMRIEEGQTVNFTEQDRSYELAIVNRSDVGEDDESVLSGSMLVSGKTISRKELPFDIHVVAYFNNSTNQVADVAKPNLATAGLGRNWVAKEEKPVSGTDNKINMPSAYLTFTKKGSSESLGTYLVGLAQTFQEMAEQVSLNGQVYDVSLRFKRSYKSYSIRLDDFRHDTYLGTSKAKNFTSDLRLTDPSRGVDRKVRIWMNNPLRYEGETFYQSGFATNAKTGAEITILQIVSNRGWMIPYVACMMVGTGMFAYFWSALARFLRRRAETLDLLPSGDVAPTSGRYGKVAPILVPLVTVVLAIGFLISVAIPPTASNTEMNLYEFGKLPVVYGGRVKPFDTLARNGLSILSKKQTFKDESDKTQPAIHWLLDVITDSDNSTAHRIFRIEDLDVLQTLQLERREGLRYAFKEFYNDPNEFYRQVEIAGEQQKEDRSGYQKRLLQLDSQIRFFRLLEESFRMVQVRQGREQEDLSAAMKEAGKLARYQAPLAVPDQETSSSTVWHLFASAWANAQSRELEGQDPNPAAIALGTILAAYASGDEVEQFNRGVAEYRLALKNHPPEDYSSTKTDFEVFFNHSQPFLWSAFLYLFAFLLASLAWLGWTVPLNRASFWLIVLTLVVHTAALVARVYISGRPPVTNLYSSAVFIGWACVVLGVVLELIYGMGIGNVLASVVGFTSLLIAFFLSRSGDTFVVLQAVLDTQFWLATHVVCITLGYSTMFVAGFLGILYIVRGVCTPSLSQRVSEELSRMIYGIVCFSIFFSLVGTVLGGLWADDSWGRFWGWDPKENGALIIVLWNMLVLHAWWGELVRDRGLAVLAIGGNICTAWSWFGTNELGVGLHSYGFTEGVLWTFGIFCATQLAVIAIGLLPQAWWWSLRAASTSK